MTTPLAARDRIRTAAEHRRSMIQGVQNALTALKTELDELETELASGKANMRGWWLRKANAQRQLETFWTNPGGTGEAWVRYQVAERGRYVGVLDVFFETTREVFERAVGLLDERCRALGT